MSADVADSPDDVWRVTGREPRGIGTRAAGALTWRRQGEGLQVALVHRSRYDDWSWPKGKLDAGEAWCSAAVREVAEETGLRVRLSLPLPTARYRVSTPTGELQDKVVRYWAASVVGGDGALEHEVDDVRWLGVDDAERQLTYRHDRRQLEALSRADRDGLLHTWPLAIVRHAKATPRKAWSGDDWLRPLDARGERQAAGLVGVLSAYGVRRALTSTATRCIDTVVPFVEASGADLDATKWLSEEGYQGAPHWLGPLVDERLDAAEPAVLCSHGPVLPHLVGLLADRADQADQAGRAARSVLSQGAADKLVKGEALVAHIVGRGANARVVAAERHLPTC
ncbi:MAG: NUDIX hydrolase [Dermatophilaceae bacterium]